MSRRTRRILQGLGIGIGGPVGLFLLWALFWTIYNPWVPLAEPRVLERAPRSGTLSVVLAGDFAPTDAALPILRERGWRYPYEATAELLREADVAFANLEAPVTLSDDEFPLYKKYIYKVDPAAVEAWNWLGLDVVSLANNHTGDYRDRGLLDTLEYLDEAGIERVGGGGDETEARRPVIFDVGGTRIGFLAYLENSLAHNLYLRAFAVGDRVGCAQLNDADLVEDVARLRPLVDVLIVSVHWGKNYSGITEDQEEWARRMAELEVDVVAGHHAHDVQGAEVIGRTLVFYSLGNYAWGTPGYPHLRLGFLARLRIAPRERERPGRVLEAEILPIVTQNRIVDFQPRRLRPDEREWLEPFLQESRRRGLPVSEEGTTLRVTLGGSATE